MHSQFSIGSNCRTTCATSSHQQSRPMGVFAPFRAVGRFVQNRAGQQSKGQTRASTVSSGVLSKQPTHTRTQTHTHTHRHTRTHTHMHTRTHTHSLTHSLSLSLSLSHTHTHTHTHAHTHTHTYTHTHTHANSQACIHTLAHAERPYVRGRGGRASAQAEPN